MTLRIPKKLLVINDMCGVGRCSMSVALPVISACKVQACPLPTAIFSNHLGFDSHYKRDLTEDMTPYMNQLSSLDLSFDGIYCGYLGRVEQMDLVKHFIHTTSSNAESDFQVLIDPVMGDHGKTYKSITPEFCEGMKSFISCATLITPNITEACLLTDTPYKESNWRLSELQLLGEQLKSLGPRQIVITGMKDESNFYNYIYESPTSNTLLTFPIAGDSRPGTGDLFASILASLTLQGICLRDATKRAARFIATCTKTSNDLNVPVKEGVVFELFLDQLNE